MGKDINKVELRGSVGSIDYRAKDVVSLSLATSSYYRDKTSGEQKSKVEWHRVTFFSPLSAKIKELGIDKGSRVMVDAILKTNVWQKDGVEQKTLGIVGKSLERLVTVKKVEPTNNVQPIQGQAVNQVQPVQQAQQQQYTAGGYAEY